ncbi:uncharacterized protein E6C27_scaffold437G00780 [Cucumis melo var. makuwa]|uniref:Uncharacterized protein n=1 Tax=Cucumis melo var. makuwa TaxID=1194695 RepID=A0A5A7UFP5_CUCMM|nr:uncharacterized protein E6C27_scaffold437G00780 [Cucumis melo var. makuwa]
MNNQNNPAHQNAKEQNLTYLAHDLDKPIRSYASPNLYDFNLGIFLPNVWLENQEGCLEALITRLRIRWTLLPAIVRSGEMTVLACSKKVGDWRKEQRQAISLNPLLPPPFPDRLKKKGDNQEFYNFLDIPKQLHINISFADALEHMPFQVKLLKHILVKKRRINDCETMALTQATNDISKNGMPEKITDPSSFTVSCSIGGMNLGRALCDIAASINLMPFSIFKKL